MTRVILLPMRTFSDDAAALPESVRTYIHRLEAKSTSLSQRVHELELELATARAHHAQAHGRCSAIASQRLHVPVGMQHGLPRRARGHVW